MELDMWEYTVEGAKAKEIEEQGRRMREQSTERVIASDRHDLSSKDESVGEQSYATSAATRVASTTTSNSASTTASTSSYPSLASFTSQRVETSPPSSSSSQVATPSVIVIHREECYYELSGVVLHCGSARSGHYYSLVRDRDGDRDRGRSSDRDGVGDRVNDKDRGDCDMANEGSTNRIKESYGDVDIERCKDTERDREGVDMSTVTFSPQQKQDCMSQSINSITSAASSAALLSNQPATQPAMS
jgi:hypothetical protein